MIRRYFEIIAQHIRVYTGVTQDSHGRTGDGVGVDDPLSNAAREIFGINYLFPYQRLVVSNVLEKRNQIVVLPTGAGKSFCFLLPAALLDGLTIIVYPLRSLIADQARRLSTGSIRAEALTGETARDIRPAIFRRCESGETRILLTNPEMLIQPGIRTALQKCRIAHLVIDEAHVLPEWGGSFRPAYLEFAKTTGEFSPSIISAFTATASPPILSGIESCLFRDSKPHHVLGIPDRPNIHYSVRPVLSIRHEMRKIAQTEPRPMIVFCRSRASAELTAETLRADTGDRRIRFYHAGLEPEEKGSIEKWFFDANDAILASTCAYGMGVDKSNIRTVVHGEIPESVEAYLQETGRAGRDGQPSQAVAIRTVYQRMLKQETGRIESGRSEQIRRYLTKGDRCRRRYLLELLGCDDIDCTGCDVCDGNARDEAAELPGIRQFMRKNGRRYTATGLERMLEPVLARSDGFRWTTAETQEAVHALISTNIIGIPGSWLGRLLFGRTFVLPRGLSRYTMRHE